MISKIDEEPRCSILVADDDPYSLKLLANMLEENGYDVRVVSNGQQVIDSAEELPPDMFMLDVHMQVMDGYETCKKLKLNEKLATIPVIFISGLSEPFNKIRGFELGAVDYINKPFSLDEVRSRVKTHLDLANKLRELEEMNAAMINREMRVIELKEEVNQLAKELGREQPYPAVWQSEK